MPRSPRNFKKKKGIACPGRGNAVNNSRHVQSVNNVETTPVASTSSKPYASASSKKLFHSVNIPKNSSVNTSKTTNWNCIIDLSLLSAALSNFVLCKYCGVNIDEENPDDPEYAPGAH